MIGSDFKNSWLGWNNLPEIREGRCTDGCLEYMYNILKIACPKSILEIGFNGGHSACCFLNASPSAKMYTFDICRWGIEEKALSVLKEHFDINLIKGDSIYKVPEFLEKNNLLFDLIFIDGCHDYDIALLDIKNTMNFLSNDGILIVDDLHMGGVYSAVTDSGIDNIYNSNVVEIKTNKTNTSTKKSQLYCRPELLNIKKNLETIVRPFVIFKKGKL